MKIFNRFNRFADVVGAHDRYPILEVYAKASATFQAINDRLRPPKLELRAVGIELIPNIYIPFEGSYPLTQGFKGASHPANDWGMPGLTPLFAPFPGKVVKAGYSTVGYAYHIAIQNDDLGPGLFVLMAHLDKKQGIAVSMGQTVHAGQLVAYSDNTGNSTGPHLHLELRKKPYRYATDGFDSLPYLVPLRTSLDWDTPDESEVTITDYPGAVTLDGMEFEMLNQWTQLNIRNGPGVSYQDIGDLNRSNFPIKARRIYAPSLWIEIEPGKWCAVDHANYQYLKQRIGQ